MNKKKVLTIVFFVLSLNLFGQDSISLKIHPVSLYYRIKFNTEFYLNNDYSVGTNLSLYYYIYKGFTIDSYFRYYVYHDYDEFKSEFIQIGMFYGKLKERFVEYEYSNGETFEFEVPFNSLGIYGGYGFQFPIFKSATLMDIFLGVRISSKPKNYTITVNNINYSTNYDGGQMYRWIGPGNWIIANASIKIPIEKINNGKKKQPVKKIDKNYDKGIPILTASANFIEPSGNNLLDAEEDGKL